MATRANAVQSVIRTLDHFIPTMKNSKFRESGMLTPEEFEAAGDYLVYHCPTWSWAGGEKKKSYLSPEKQFLVTRSVPCYKRCSQMEEIPENEKIIHLDQDDEGWVDTHHGFVVDQVQEKVEEMTLEGDKQPEVAATMPPARTEDTDSDSDSDEPAMNIDEFEVEDDPATVAAPKPKQAATNEQAFIQTRTYDLNITYDNYYRTPRLWLFGYDENKKPLTEVQTYEDISQDHLNKTVSLEPHPHLSCHSMSVHPCRHAEVMKKIMTMIEEDGRELQVHAYLLVFLKFVQAVIPTIEYDYTQQLAITSA